MTDMPDDPFESDVWKQFAEHAIDGLLPMMKDSAVCVTMIPDSPSDVKFAVELGFSIMLDKPIIAMVVPGTKISDHLRRVADEIVEWNFDNPAAAAESIQAAVRRLLPKDSDDD